MDVEHFLQKIAKISGFFSRISALTLALLYEKGTYILDFAFTSHCSRSILATQRDKTLFVGCRNKK